MTEAMQFQAHTIGSYRLANDTLIRLVQGRDETVVYATDEHGVRHPVRLLADEAMEEGETTEEEDEFDDEELDEIIRQVDL